MWWQTIFVFGLALDRIKLVSSCGEAELQSSENITESFGDLIAIAEMINLFSLSQTYVLSECVITFDESFPVICFNLAATARFPLQLLWIQRN